jgi:subtilisin family serine protease
MRAKERHFFGGATFAGALALTIAAFDGAGTAASPREIESGSIDAAFAAHRPETKARPGNNGFHAPEPASLQALPGHLGHYARAKLRLSLIHPRGRGRNVRIAVIDSQIDETHPDIRSSIAGRYDTTGGDENPHPHGTGIAGAILSVAPGANILAVRVFSSGGAKPETSTDNILRGLEWAIQNNVRIVNMSFAGPRDPSLERALKTAHDRGVILIAAVGNAGSGAEPLFPASDPHVIAVTATDRDDRIFESANRGAHVAVAAPGVDVLTPAPGGQYQLTTGTSIAAAHVSGVVALMLERNPALTPADVRRILTASARRVGSATEFGAGLVDPMQAMQLSAPRSPIRTVRR